MSDDDDLERLAKAMKAATPAPDAARKAAHLARAMENFDAAQGSAKDTRPNPDRTQTGGGFGQGVKRMFQAFTSRGALAATTAIVAVGVTLVFYQQNQDPNRLGFADWGRRAPAEAPVTTPAPTPEPSVQGTDAIAEVPAPFTLPRLEAEETTTRSRDAENFAAAAPEMPDTASSGEGRVVGTVAEEKASGTARFGVMGQPNRASPPPGFQLRSDNDIVEVIEPDTEAYPDATPNPLKIVSEEPVSTFSIDVDTAGWAVIRSSLTRGQLPPEGAVRIEEMVNYFPYAYPAPEGPHPFLSTVTVMDTPWNPDTDLVHIAIQGERLAVEERPPLNLVFLIDTSGSMQNADKLPLLKQSFRLMLAELRPQDEVAIVTYAGSAGQVLAPTPAGERATILAALDRLEAGGSTAGQAGLQQAYAVAEGMAGEGEVSRILLATDGDFNVGLSDPEALKDYIAAKRESGTYLSVLGFGRGNLDDATMQALAQNGNGTAAYIDTLNEARKVLVDQLSGALFPIADDVKIQVEFNPTRIAEYRLIGYETRALAREDFNNDKVDAGEIGAGHQVTAIYEVTPVGSPAVMNDPLRYGQANVRADYSDDLGFLKLRYKQPDEDASTLIEQPIREGQGEAGTEARFAAAIAGFGQLLQGGKYLGEWSWGDAIALAAANRGEDAFGYRAEAVNLMRLAEGLSR